MKYWERLPHTADIKLRVYGANQQELFENAAKAMFEVVLPVYSRGGERVTREVHVEAPDVESLLVTFLSEILSLSAVHGEGYDRCSVMFFSMGDIRAIVQGLPVERFERGEIKAVTYHDLSIKEHDGVLLADIVFDV